MNIHSAYNWLASTPSHDFHDLKRVNRHSLKPGFNTLLFDSNVQTWRKAEMHFRQDMNSSDVLTRLYYIEHGKESAAQKHADMVKKASREYG